jgi:hypothetical protein
MPQNRWVQPPADPSAGGGGHQLPPISSLEVVYRSDPDLVRAVVPPPLQAAPDAKVHLRFTDIDLDFGTFTWQEKVGWFGVDVVHDGLPGEYPLLIPIDLERAIAISRERHGEPKKLAEITVERDGADVRASMTRMGVTFAEVAGSVTGTLPVPEPYETRQFWFKFMPARSPGAASTAMCCWSRSTRSARPSRSRRSTARSCCATSRRRRSPTSPSRSSSRCSGRLGVRPPSRMSSAPSIPSRSSPSSRPATTDAWPRTASSTAERPPAATGIGSLHSSPRADRACSGSATYPRHPLSLAQAALSVQAASGGRVTLGIGPSHPYVIETMYGLTWDRPAHHTAEYVQALRACFATGPDDNIVPVDGDADRARTRAAELFSAYEGVPTYQRVFERNQSPWPVDAAVIGDERTVADRIRRFGELGATDFLATVLGLGDDPGASRDRTFALLASLL